MSGSNKSNAMTIEGTLASLNAALNGMTYAPVSNFTGTVFLGLTYTDLGDGLIAAATVQITIIPGKNGGGSGPGPGAAAVGTDRRPPPAARLMAPPVEAARPWAANPEMG